MRTFIPRIAAVFATAVLCACGSDPYSGDSSGKATKTVTVTNTVTTTVTDTNGDTQTATGIYTATATSTPTSSAGGTGTTTTTSTGPTTMTMTTIVTVTVTDVGTQPDAGVAAPDAAILDPSHKVTEIRVAPTRLLDLVFMIDNSPGMSPKVDKMNAQLPKLFAALKDPSDNTLPDLRVAVIDSDLGTGGAYINNSCARKTLPDGTESFFGDLGRFQMLTSPQNCTFNPGALFLEYKAGAAVNYTGDINTVLACLTSNTGTNGCGEEHPLQAFEFALAARGVGNETQQAMFLRRNAQLGLVFLTEEDDCSAATNDRLFGDLVEARGESASLRCATRAHKCNGRNLTDSPPGYPTSASFTARFADCQARIGDECSLDTDTSKPTDCNPLRNVKTFANEIKSLRESPDDVFVAGIFGWPLSDADMATAEYKIAPVPNPNMADTLHPTVYDYWPVCYDPDHPPTHPDPTTGLDLSAMGWGATGGLRESAFIDEFGANGMKFSICQRDFSATMKTIGDTLARKLQNPCLDEKLFDTDTARAGVQAECEVNWLLPRQDPQDPTRVIYDVLSPSLSQCPDGATSNNIADDCWYLTKDLGKCPVNGQVVQVLRTAEHIKDKTLLDPGTRVRMNCHVCPASSTEPGCDYNLGN